MIGPSVALAAWTLLYTAFFLALHQWVRRLWPGGAFHWQLAVSRGLAACALVALGAAVLVGAFEDWPRAFVDRRPPGDPAYLIIAFVLGHLLADFAWLVHGWRSERSRPRLDLVVHHLLGLAACALVLWLEVAPLLVGVALTSEVMPVSSGLFGFARLRRDAGLARVAQALRLWALLGWRLPLWGFLIWRSLPLAGVETTDDLGPIYLLVVVAVGCVVALDLRWSHLAWQALRPAPP